MNRYKIIYVIKTYLNNIQKYIMAKIIGILPNDRCYLDENWIFFIGFGLFLGFGCNNGNLQKCDRSGFLTEQHHSK